MKQKQLRKKQLMTKKQKTVSGFLGGMIIFIMIGSALNFYGSDEENSVEYKGIDFVNTGNGWVGNKENGKQIVLITNPEMLDNITIPNVNLAQMDFLTKVYISYDPRQSVRGALYQFQRNIALSPRLVAACTVDIEQCEEIPIKTCEDTTTTTGVIIFEEANETEVSLKNNCLTIKGKDLIEITDKIVVEQS